MQQLFAVLVLLCALHSATAIHAKTRPQKTDYTHVSKHALANEFQLIDPALITFNAVPEGFESEAKFTGLAGPGYTIHPIGKLLINNDQVVNVTYSSLKPNASDWIAAYSPALTNISTHVPVKFGMCNTDPDYMTSGKGVLSFNFTNLRSDISFYFFTNGLHQPITQASTVDSPEEWVDFVNYNEPLRPRMVATGNYDIYNLLWSTNNSANPILKWGTVSGTYTTQVSARTKYITEDDVCQGYQAKNMAHGPGWRSQGAIHTADLVGMTSLAAGSKIYYVFGDETIPDGISREYEFIVPPLAGVVNPLHPTTAILYCDLGRGSTDDTETWNAYGRPAINTTMSAAALISEGNVDVVFHGGDISYAVGYMAVWDFFLDMLSPVASRVLYFTTVGNHESDWPESATIYNQTDSGGECGVMSTGLLPMPLSTTKDTPWWSYNVGLIHFVGMSTEHNFTECSPQYQFLEQDLASVDRSVTPWIVFNGHRAMYINSDFMDDVSYSDGTVMKQLVDNIEPLLYKYRVNAAFWGHNHVFQRQSAVYNYTVVEHSKDGQNADGDSAAVYENPQATVQIVIGNAGATFSDNALAVPPVWNEVTAMFYGYSVVKAYNATYLTWDTIDSNTVNGDKVMDRVVITQDAAFSSWTLPDTPAFNQMPKPHLATCSNSPPPPASDASNNDDESGSSGAYIATVSSIAVVSVLTLAGGVWWFRKSYSKREDNKDANGGYLKNPLITETFD